MSRYQPIKNHGDKAYHLTEAKNIPSIFQYGLKPSEVSGDGVKYGEQRIYFLLDTNIEEVDTHLKNRVCLEVDVSEMVLYRDMEYDNIFGADDNPMAFVVTSTSIPADRIRLTGLSIG